MFSLATSGREDIVFLVFNIWVLGMSFVAILNESMPHMYVLFHSRHGHCSLIRTTGSQPS